MQQSGQIIEDLLYDNLEVYDSETTIELNLALLKLKQTIKKKRPKYSGEDKMTVHGIYVNSKLSLSSRTANFLRNMAKASKSRPATTISIIARFHSSASIIFSPNNMAGI